MFWLLLGLAHACEHHLTQRPTIIVRPEQGDAGHTLPGYEFFIRSQKRRSDPDTKRELVHVMPPSGQVVRIGTNRATEIVDAGALTLSEPTLETPGKVLSLRSRDLSTVIGKLTASELMVTGIETFAASSDLRRIAVQDSDGMLTVAELEPSTLLVLGRPYPIAKGVRPLEYIGDTLLAVSDRGELLLFSTDGKVVSKTAQKSVQASLGGLFVHESSSSRRVALFDDRRLIVADLSQPKGRVRVVQEVPEEVRQATFDVSGSSIAFVGEHRDPIAIVGGLFGDVTATVGVLQIDWTSPEIGVRLVSHQVVSSGNAWSQAEVVRESSGGWIVAGASGEEVVLSRLDSSGLTRLETLSRVAQPGSLALWREGDHTVVRFRTRDEMLELENAEGYELRGSGSSPWVSSDRPADSIFEKPSSLPPRSKDFRGFRALTSSAALAYEWDGRSLQAVDPQGGKVLRCEETGDLIRLESFAKKNREATWLTAGPRGSFFVFYQPLNKPGWQIRWMANRQKTIISADLEAQVVIDPQRGLVPRYEAPGVLVIPTRERSGFISNFPLAVYY